MFHPRTAVFEQPITYHLPSSNTNSTPSVKSENVDFSQYYISEICVSSSNVLNEIFSLALESRTTILKSAKGPVSVAECDPQGRFVQIENTSRSKSISLAHWTLHQERDHGETIVYRFPENTLLKPNYSLKVCIFSSFMCQAMINRHDCYCC